MYTEDAHKHYKFCKSRARYPPLRAIILVKFEIFKVLEAVNPHSWADQGEMPAPPWSLGAKFHLDRSNLSPLRGEKTQKSTRGITGRLVLRASPAGNKTFKLSRQYRLIICESEQVSLQLPFKTVSPFQWSDVRRKTVPCCGTATEKALDPSRVRVLGTSKCPSVATADETFLWFHWLGLALLGHYYVSWSSAITTKKADSTWAARLHL